MKKTEILKVRVDAETHTALKRYCETSGQSVSYVMREILNRELANNGSTIGFERRSALANDKTRTVCARMLASMLVPRLVTHAAPSLPPECLGRQYKVSRLLTELFRVLGGDDTRPMLLEQQVSHTDRPQ